MPTDIQPAKTYEQCCDEVAKKYDCSDWEMLMINLNQSDIKKTAFEVSEEAAELYNQETSAERDRLKEELRKEIESWEEWAEGEAKLIASLKGENERLKGELRNLRK